MKKIFPVIGLLILLSACVPVMATEAPSEIPSPAPVSGLLFSEMWSMYFHLQLTADEDTIGYSPDFGDYCTSTPRGCGFDSTAPNFDKEFHGSFVGYKAEKDIQGIWRYYPISN